ncbi:pachytene checkpoint protein 2 [Histomonas meleagridis]|uniref:pachytene checkpoint protein 2-like n=1 Tax=Histomonas meleagridis TaxID=135588 RepID=UPI003559BC2C|nr:pachytene checkpoint protein 2 [Histomonas meleagridis]KAH0806909.1 pachytene checkpoint protein 2-like [Histomonas meleagridis]
MTFWPNISMDKQSDGFSGLLHQIDDVQIKIHMDVEIAIQANSAISTDEIRTFFEGIANEQPNIFLNVGNVGSMTKHKIIQSVHLPSNEYEESIEQINIYGDTPPIKIHCYILNHDESHDDIIDNDGEILSIAQQTILPSEKFQNDFDSVIFEGEESNIKSMLLNFMETSVQFANHDVCPDTVTSNRIILLYGPPGTGKTTICHGLAQKLSIRFSHIYQYGTILEINTHSLFSKWFAESGKMVKKLFDRINSIASDHNVLVIVLIDEVESLATARESSMNGSDPSDAIRVVNALLTQIDQLRKKTNVIMLATSNLTECIDIAFLSRADIKQYIGPPSKIARYIILKSCVDELYNKGIVESNFGLLDYDKLSIFQQEVLQTSFQNTYLLLKSAEKCEGLSGRILRRLPFLAFVYKAMQIPAKYLDFIDALDFAISQQFEKKNSE